MKILKIKSLLLSLFAIALISTFLTSCENNDIIDAVSQEVLNQKEIDPEVAAAIKDIDLLSDEAFASIPTYLPTDTEIKEMSLKARASSTSVESSIYLAASDQYVGGVYTCFNQIYHFTDWNPAYGNCTPSNWTWYNVQKKRSNGKYTTEFSGLLDGNYYGFTPNNISNGEYISAIFAWNQCQGKWTLEASMSPTITRCGL